MLNNRRRIRKTLLTRNEYINQFWEPYLLSEREFLKIVDYVALRDNNLGTSSEKLIRCLLNTCELFESLMKSMYGLGKRSSFDEYFKHMQSDAGFNMGVQIEMLRGMLTISLEPFVGASPVKAPSWWTAHNKVKHHRAARFDMGNLGNCLMALAALYYVNCLFVKRVGDYWHARLPHTHENCIDVPNDISKLFRCKFICTRHTVASYETYAITAEEIEDMFN